MRDARHAANIHDALQGEGYVLGGRGGEGEGRERAFATQALSSHSRDNNEPFSVYLSDSASYWTKGAKQTNAVKGGPLKLPTRSSNSQQPATRGLVRF